jgi:hypothetical protein
VSSFELEPHDLNSHLNETLHGEGVTGRAKVLTGRITRGVRFEYRKGPESIFVDRMRLIVTDWTRHRVRSTPCVLLL